MGTVLVTGGGGYIGSVLVRKLLSAGHTVKAVDRYFFGRDKLSPNDRLQIIVDDSRRLTDELFQGVDHVIDLVAISNDPSAELFRSQTWAINCDSRINTASLAKKMGVKKYILPSSASIYGYQDAVVDETSPINPLTVYAKANAKVEQEVLKLANEGFSVTVLRQATVFGYSPRMRFDLAINGMTYGCWKTGKLPLMRDGKQYRPMVHVQDTTDVMLLLLNDECENSNGEIFNVGSEENNFQLEALAVRIAECVGKTLGRKIDIEWYGDPDLRSYRLSFAKIEQTLGWTARRTVEEGVAEIVHALETGMTDKTPQTITLEWYQNLVRWHRIIKEVEKYGGILDLE